MCRLLHVEWRCGHLQNILEYCRDCPRTPGPSPQPLRTCDSFFAQHGPNPTTPTADEYRNHCCRFTCCLADQADLFTRVGDLEGRLGLPWNGKLKGGRFVPGWMRGGEERELQQARGELKRLLKRHGERCEALYYGLGWLVKGAEGWRTEVKGKPAAENRDVVAGTVGANSVKGHRHTRSEGQGEGGRAKRVSTASAPGRV